ncbi:MAG: hypothetical protein GY765_02935 [bacterium]|nr:hypothetical protein [bacterium]
MDSTTWLPMEIEFRDSYYNDRSIREDIDKRILYSDYKKFNGVLFPAHTLIYEKGKKKWEFTFNSVTVRPTVSMEIFDRPDRELDMRFREERLH